MKRALLAFVLLAIGLLLYYERASPPAPSSAAATSMPAAQNAAPDMPVPAASEFPLNAPGSDIRVDLHLVSDTLETFRTNFLRTGNPTGNNAEITAALTGQNPLRLALFAPNHPAINARGELCDRWGTPFFFHAESATQMDVRSAGPDRKMWTDDDVVHTP